MNEGGSRCGSAAVHCYECWPGCRPSEADIARRASEEVTRCSFRLMVFLTYRERYVVVRLYVQWHRLRILWRRRRLRSSSNSGEPLGSPQYRLHLPAAPRLFVFRDTSAAVAASRRSSSWSGRLVCLLLRMHVCECVRTAYSRVTVESTVS